MDQEVAVVEAAAAEAVVVVSSAEAHQDQQLLQLDQLQPKLQFNNNHKVEV